jgi:hypothetical protein
VTRRAFDPEQPIDRPARRLACFATAVRADALLEAEAVIDALRASGCDEIHVEFDTLGVVGEPRAQRLAALVETLQRHGMRVHGVFTLGQDHDDAGCFERLVAWVEDQRLADVELRLWTPDPGGELIRELARADRVRHRDLHRWDGAHVVVTPANMSAQTLYRGWVWARRRLSSLGSRWRRRPPGLAALPGYLLEVCRAALVRARFAFHGLVVFTPVETARTRPSASVRARFAFHGLIVFTPVETIRSDHSSLLALRR